MNGVIMNDDHIMKELEATNEYKVGQESLLLDILPMKNLMTKN